MTITKQPRSPRGCDYCGEAFLPKFPSSTTRYCGRRCSTTAQHRNAGSDVVLADTDAAWLAGLFDGEGSIVWLHKDRPVATVRLTVTNTSLELLERIVAVTGAGKVGGHRPNPTNPNHRPTWVWTCYGGAARALMRQMLPWLIVKRAKAEEALALNAVTADFK